jgi:hypothetical protein
MHCHWSEWYADAERSQRTLVSFALLSRRKVSSHLTRTSLSLFRNLVDLVAKNFFGSWKEFEDEFARPIKLGR